MLRFASSARLFISSIIRGHQVCPHKLPRRAGPAAMARMDLLVDGLKYRFALSTASTDSIFPEHLVPPGRLVLKAVPRLVCIDGSEITTCGLYQAVLESSDVDFVMSFALTVGRGGNIPVLGTDFLNKVQMKSLCMSSPGYLEVVNQKDAKVRLLLSERPHKLEEDGIIFVPTVRRLTPPSEPTRLASSTGLQTTKVIFFHLETTGFGFDAEIIEITAICPCYSLSFNVNILPDGDIHPMAAEKNGFKKFNRLFRSGEAVYVTPRWQAAEGFLAFLRDVGGDVVLAAHNAFPFHAPLLAKLLSSLGLSKQFESLVRSVADTVPLFRKALPGRTAAGKTFSLEDLAKDILKDKFKTWDRTEATLEKLVKKVGISFIEIIESGKPPKEFYA